jgi:hypothetical protein
MMVCSQTSAVGVPRAFFEHVRKLARVLSNKLKAKSLLKNVKRFTLEGNLALDKLWKPGFGCASAVQYSRVDDFWCVEVIEIERCVLFVTGSLDSHFSLVQLGNSVLVGISPRRFFEDIEFVCF